MNKNQLDIYYQVINQAKTSFPVIFIHGYGKSQTVFKHQIAYLEPYFKLILFDAIGDGYSDKPQIDLYENLVDATVKDVYQLCKFLKLGSKFGLIGHSLFGCAVAQKIAIEKGDDISFLILLNGGTLILDSTIRSTFWNLVPQYTRMHFNHLAEMSIDKLITRMIPYLIKILTQETEDFYLEDENLSKEEVQLLHMKIRDDLFSFLNYPLTPDYISAPTLIIAAELDNFAPSYMSKELHERIPDSKFYIVTMAGHFGLTERENEYNKLIGKFLMNHEFIPSKK